MNILLHGYLDRNFGDDMMIQMVAKEMPNHTFMLNTPKKELLIPFRNVGNIIEYSGQNQIDAELWVIGSGFQIASKTALISSFLESLKDKKKCPRAVIGCNIGPFYGKFAERLIKKRLKTLDYISVREKWSYQYLKGLLPKTKINCYPDILFGIDDEIIPPKKNEGLLGIVAYRRMNRNNMEYYRKMARLADDYIENSEKKVLIFAFDAEQENDISAAYTIAGLCRNKDSIEIIVHNSDGANIIENFSRCEKVVSARFHGIVLAIRMGIPVVPQAYSEKTRNMLEDLEFDGRVFDIDNFDYEELKTSLTELKKPFVPDSEVFLNSRQHIKKLREECYE